MPATDYFVSRRPDFKRQNSSFNARKAHDFMPLALEAGECQNFFLSLLKRQKVKTRSHARKARIGVASPAPVQPGRRGGTSHNLFVPKENEMTFRPLHDRILVRRIEADEKTAGGIIIPDTAKEKPQEGEVIAVGPGARDESGKLVELDVKVGDRILFGKWSGTEIKLDGEDLLIMKESDVMGVIEDAGTLRKAA
jgi:chaperonin GroES